VEKQARKDVLVIYICFGQGSLRTVVLKHVLGRALESQRTKGDCREVMKTIFND
jgi:hypothetical protein